MRNNERNREGKIVVKECQMPTEISFWTSIFQFVGDFSCFFTRLQNTRNSELEQIEDERNGIRSARTKKSMERAVKRFGKAISQVHQICWDFLLFLFSLRFMFFFSGSDFQKMSMSVFSTCCLCEKFQALFQRNSKKMWMNKLPIIAIGVGIIHWVRMPSFSSSNSTARQ